MRSQTALVVRHDPYGLSVTASAQEHGRIIRKLPSTTEADRIASDMAMNDGLLRKGDIVVTDRGFFVFRGVLADGFSNDFGPVPNPLNGK